MRAAPDVPHLARLLAAAGAAVQEPDGIGAALAPHYGVVRGNGLAARGDPDQALGVDPGDAYWVAADPVTLVAGRDDVHLAGMVRDLGADEAARLTATLNAHFAADGMAFVAPRPDAWFVRAAVAPAISDATARRRRRPHATRMSARRAAMREGGGAGKTKSRCCCTSIPSTRREKRADARR